MMKTLRHDYPVKGKYNWPRLRNLGSRVFIFACRLIEVVFAVSAAIVVVPFSRTYVKRVEDNTHYPSIDLQQQVTSPAQGRFRRLSRARDQNDSVCQGREDYCVS